MAAPRFPLRAVAALFLERQHLARPRARRFTPRRVVQFIEDAGGLQLDSINVLDRAHYLGVWSRFGPYDRGRLDRLVYRRRALFESSRMARSEEKLRACRATRNSSGVSGGSLCVSSDTP